MSEVPIPPASLERLRGAYAQFEQLCAVVAEAMNVRVTQVNLPKGVFVVDDGEVAAPGAERANGVPA